MFNLLISEHLVLAATGEWAASRRCISRFLKIFMGLLNQHESLSCLPHKHESRIIKTQGKPVTQKLLQDLMGFKALGGKCCQPEVTSPACGTPQARQEGCHRAEGASRQSLRAQGHRTTTQAWPRLLTGWLPQSCCGPHTAVRRPAGREQA